MSFTTLAFGLFFLATLAAHLALPRRAAWQNAHLVASGIFFYFVCNPRFVPLLVLSTAVDYALALDVDRHRHGPRRAKFGLALSLAFNLGLLGYFKYAGFFASTVDDVARLLGLATPLPVPRLALPLGISFFTFQKVGYLLDVYDGRIAPCRSALRFAAFVMFFPQLTAGPIARGDELLPQLEAPRSLGPERLRRGAMRFFAGFVKKAFVADYLAQNLVDPAFADPARYGTAGLWIALAGYAAQVFCDFSGYTDMAIGCAVLLGVDLPENFNLPFLARSLLDFWRRWHITLNRWWFDYIYGRLTTGDGWFRGRLDAAFILVFLLSGLWHGPRWTFVAWGLLHGLGLVLNHQWDERYRALCRRDRAWVARRKSTAYQLTAWLLTQAFFVLSLVPFRAVTLGEAGAYARGLVTFRRGLTLPVDAPRLRAVNLALCLTFVVGLHVVESEAARSLRARFAAMPAVLRGVVYGIVTAWLMLFVPVTSGTFIYANF
ncbi:MAG: MBOAT family O-acyltransferase [Polyangiales bacterium]